MPAPTVLSHCIPVRVFGPAVPPKYVIVHMDVGGSKDDGHVDVKSGGGGGPIVGSVETGKSGDVIVDPATEIWLHYVAGPGKPQTVEVQCEFAIS